MSVKEEILVLLRLNEQLYQSNNKCKTVIFTPIPASGCSIHASGVHGPAFTYPRFSRAKTKPPSPITGPSANRSRRV